MGADLIFELYKDKRTVFSLQEIAMLINESNFIRLKQRINYYVQTKKLKNLRRGIYAKENYSIEELACKIYKPAYISLEYVLQKAGIAFQYNSRITMLCYLSRTIEVDANSLIYRKIKNNVLYNTVGITRNNNGINIAIPERAFLDTLYLNTESYFDTIISLNKEVIFSMLSIYQSNQLQKRVQILFKNG